MKTFLMWALCLALMLPSSVLGGLQLPCASSIQESKPPGVILNPYVQVGFQHLGVNLTFPINAERVLPIGSLEIGPLDAALKDARFWQGNLGLNAIVSPKVTFFALAGGFSPRLLLVPAEVPIALGPASLTANLEFTASNFEVWLIQLGAAYSLMPGFSIIGGLYWDHTSLEIADPRQEAVPIENQTLRGDIQAKTWFPFIGVQVTDPRFVASLIYSPVAVTNMKTALRSSQNRLVDLRYSWNKPGQFLGFTAQYNLPFPPPVAANLWVQGTWMHVEGTVALEFESSDPVISRERERLRLAWANTPSVEG
jgi:hypothetical protein